MSVYTSDILAAALWFPLIAFLITLPYLLFQYRKYGSVPWLRSLVVYSLVFYLMCAYFLVLLPLPADRNIVVPYAQTPQLVPFNFAREIASQVSASFVASDPTTWLSVLRCPAVYEAVFNVLLLVPLGMYLRYYFRRTWWQTLILGFLVTLSFETLQLTGLLGYYAHPYRLFDVDDLMLNTLGAMTGFWLVGPMMRVLPDIRLVNEEAREAGKRAGALRRALSFLVDLLLACAVAGACAAAAVLAGAARGAGEALGGAEAAALLGASAAGFLAVFVAVPSATHGQTPGQKLLRLRIVRPDARAASWYQYLARYGLLFLIGAFPLAALAAVALADPAAATEQGAVMAFIGLHRRFFAGCWAALMAVWAIALLARGVSSARKRQPFVMLNGLLSNTRVMTCDGVEEQRERRAALPVAQVARLEQLIAQDGTPLSELMERAGQAMAEAVRLRRPDPEPVCVLAGSGNNGGDGWVAARELAQAGYPVTLLAPDIAERIKAEPARTAALSAFAHAHEHGLPLRVIVAPDPEQAADAIDGASAIVDAMLGTGFAGAEVREPYASWIHAADARRFFGNRVAGRGRHRKRRQTAAAHAQGGMRQLRRAKDAPFVVAADVPSGLSAQDGTAADPCLHADVTVTMLAYKPGLEAPGASRFTGVVRLAKLVDTRPYLELLGQADSERD